MCEGHLEIDDRMPFSCAGSLDYIPAMTKRNILLALLLSFPLTFFVVVVYTFYPLISVLLSNASSGSETGGIGAVAGGVSSLFFYALLIVEPILFLTIFALLQRRSGAKR